MVSPAPIVFLDEDKNWKLSIVIRELAKGDEQHELPSPSQTPHMSYTFPDLVSGEEGIDLRINTKSYW